MRATDFATAILPLALSSMARADPALRDSPLQIVIYSQNDGTSARKRFPGASITTYSNRGSELRKKYLTLPEQARYFQAAGLGSLTEKMDQFDRDLLIVAMRTSTPAEMHRRYAMIPLDACRRSIDLLRKIK